MNTACACCLSREKMRHYSPQKSEVHIATANDRCKLMCWSFQVDPLHHSLQHNNTFREKSKRIIGTKKHNLSRPTPHTVEWIKDIIKLHIDLWFSSAIMQPMMLTLLNYILSCPSLLLSKFTIFTRGYSSLLVWIHVNGCQVHKQILQGVEKASWEEYRRESAGNLKQPSRQDVVNWVSTAWKSITVETLIQYVDYQTLHRTIL